MLCSLVVDLNAEWTPFLTASDGAESFGFGGARAPCAPHLVRELASRSRVRDHAFVPSEHFGPDVVVGIQQTPCPMPIAFTDFSHTFSIRAKGAQHASKLEYGALCLSVKTIVRQAKWHGHRTFGLVDSLALMFAVREGRSRTSGLVHGYLPQICSQLTCSCTWGTRPAASTLLMNLAEVSCGQWSGESGRSLKALTASAAWLAVSIFSNDPCVDS